jgi:hypothetical protein
MAKTALVTGASSGIGQATAFDDGLGDVLWDSASHRARQ